MNSNSTNSRSYYAVTQSLDSKLHPLQHHVLRPSILQQDSFRTPIQQSTLSRTPQYYEPTQQVRQNLIQLNSGMGYQYRTPVPVQKPQMQNRLSDFYQQQHLQSTAMTISSNMNSKRTSAIQPHNFTVKTQIKGVEEYEVQSSATYEEQLIQQWVVPNGSSYATSMAGI